MPAIKSIYRFPSASKRTAPSPFTKTTSKLQYVKNGGVLLYCTCTINKKENEDVVNEFLKHYRTFSKEEQVELFKEVCTEAKKESVQESLVSIYGGKSSLLIEIGRASCRERV